MLEQSLSEMQLTVDELEKRMEGIDEESKISLIGYYKLLSRASKNLLGVRWVVHEKEGLNDITDIHSSWQQSHTCIPHITVCSHGNCIN